MTTPEFEPLDPPEVLPDFEIPITLEYQLEILDKAASFPENAHQLKNIEAAKNDLITKGRTAPFYQNAKPFYGRFGEQDLRLGPLWMMTPQIFGNTFVKRQPRPGEPGFKPSPLIPNPITIDQRIALLDQALTFPQNQKQKDNIEAAKQDLLTKGKTVECYQQGKALDCTADEVDIKLGPVWIETPAYMPSLLRL